MKHIAVRLKRYQDSEKAFCYKEKHEHKRQLVDSNIEKRDPALRNLIEGLCDKGLQQEVDGCSLFWFSVNDLNSVDYYKEKNEVEFVFESAWFDEQKQRIRCHRGMSYVNECIKLADQFDIKNQDRKIDYVIT